MESIIKRNPTLMMILANISLGLNSVFGKAGLEEFSAYMFIGLRYFAIGLIFISMGWLARQSIRKRDYKPIVVQVFMQTIMALAWFGGLAYTQAINAAIIFLLTPIIVYVGSVIILHEPRSDKALAGSLLALVGGFMLFGAPVLNGSTEEVLGNGLLLIAATALAGIILHSKSIVTDKNFNMVMGTRFFFAGLAGLLLAALNNGANLNNVTADGWSIMVFTITISGAFGIWLYYKSLQHMRAEDSAGLFYIDPLCGSIASALLLGETLSDGSLIASAVIVSGVLISHPVHITRTIYYLKYSQSRFEKFMQWVADEAYSLGKVVQKYF